MRMMNRDPSADSGFDFDHLPEKQLCRLEAEFESWSRHYCSTDVEKEEVVVGNMNGDRKEVPGPLARRMMSPNFAGRE